MRRIRLEVGGRSYTTHLDGAVRLSLPLDFHGRQARAFDLPRASAEPIAFAETECDTERGGAFNAESLSLIPHGNGTHTETVGHLIDRDVPVGNCATEPLVPCTVLTAEPTLLEETDETYPNHSAPDDRVVTRETIASRAAELELPPGFLRALVLRCRPDDSADRFRDYSGTNPTYLTGEALRWIVERDVEHLLVDLPSIDREYEGGTLANHRAFWSLGPEEHHQDPPSDKTVTEFLDIPDGLPDGVYFLTLQVPDFQSDAAPSRPLVFEAKPAD